MTTTKKMLDLIKSTPSPVKEKALKNNSAGAHQTKKYKRHPKHKKEENAPD